MLPGAHYSDPEFSWKFEVAPAGSASWAAARWGRSTRTTSSSGPPPVPRRRLPVPLQPDRQPPEDRRRRPAPGRPRRRQPPHKWELTESESLLFGRDFGVVTDVQTGPNGNLYLVSPSPTAASKGSSRDTRRREGAPPPRLARVSGGAAADHDVDARTEASRVPAMGRCATTSPRRNRLS